MAVDPGVSGHSIRPYLLPEHNSTYPATGRENFDSLLILARQAADNALLFTGLHSVLRMVETCDADRLSLSLNLEGEATAIGLDVLLTFALHLDIEVSPAQRPIALQLPTEILEHHPTHGRAQE